MKDGNRDISHEDILESLAEAVFTVDSAWRITSFNRGAEKISGKSRRDALGHLCYEVFRSSLCEENCPLKNAFDGDIPSVVGQAFIVNNHGQQVPVSVSAAVLRNCKHKVVGGVETFQDLRLLAQATGSMDRAVKVCEVQTIMAALHRNNNNRAATARFLGIHKSTFFRKIKTLGIDLPPTDGRFRTGTHGDGQEGGHVA
ncbi:MAG: PAS domain S-box protein [Proteobacteria bacterium]|nr:PAS domain S-box protein [Pseudomonadota bacterium]MBU1641157.1 PAS domain S-box protein [Pseudomonadota bacterium]